MRSIARVFRCCRAETGSQGLEAAGAALAAALIVLALLAGARSTLGPQVFEAFECAAAALAGGGGCGGAGAANNSAAAPPAPAQQDSGDFNLLDGIQLGLDVVGLVPGLGEVADGINGVISLGRGDTTGAALSFAAMVPFAGWAATGGKWARTGLRYSDEAAALIRNGDEMAAVSRNGVDYIPPCPIGRAPRGKGPGLSAPTAACGRATFSEIRRATEFLRDAGVPQQYRRQVIEAFGPGSDVVTLADDLKVYRYFDGTVSDPRGRWLTDVRLNDPVNELALPPGNTASNIAEWTLPRGTQVLRGPVAPNFGRPGGAIQIYLPDPSVLRPIGP